MKDLNTNTRLIVVVLLLLALNSESMAVNSKITRCNSSSDMLKGEIEKVVIGSRGTIQLGRAARSLSDQFDDFSDVWSINSIVISGGTVYFGTSPNGGIYKYSLNKITKIYPLETEKEQPKENTKNEKDPNEASASDEPNDVIEKEQLLSNEHIFAMATDISGSLLVGISGDKCRLCRFEADKMEAIFEPNDSKYIFAITIDEGGNIYLGTGPKGRIYKLDSLGRKTELVYESRDKNILSLTIGPDGFVYAGSDSRGLIYKIDPLNKDVTVLFDSEQPEIAALLFSPKTNTTNRNNKNSEDDSDAIGSLYAAATSAKIVRTQTQFAASIPAGPPAGRPETDDDKQPDEGDDEEEQEEEENTNSSLNEDERKLEIANTKQPAPAKTGEPTPPVRRSTRPTSASYIYKISPDGFVTDIFNETAVFFSLAQQDNKLLVGTGNKAQLYSVDPASEQQAVITVGTDNGDCRGRG